LKPILTIIVPVKKVEEVRFLLLIRSILFLQKYHEVQTVVVYSELSPKELLLENGINNESIEFYFTEPKGIYNAFNFGISKAKGKWIMFFGGDDLILPSMNELLNQIEKQQSNVAAIVGNVVFGDKQIFQPFRSKYGLIFKNWCQQGVLYNNKVFVSLLFDEKYPIQADHKFNIQIAARWKNQIKYIPNVISYFNISGISQTVNDLEFRKDLPSIISNNFGKFWGTVTLLKRWIANQLQNR
jgi:glycosyltransferase involved in cell wall biosynthesis